jgi:hypothetical protein
MERKKITVVTCSMNRHDYLKEVVESTNNIDNLLEHILIDFSSDERIDNNLIEINPKLKIITVKNESTWWLARAYNIAFWLAKGNFILKLDADTVLNAEEVNKINLNNVDGVVFEHQGGMGNFIIRKNLIQEVNGFNEYIFHWGYDDRDLIERISSLKPKSIIVENSKKFITVNDHPNIKRFNIKHKYSDSLALAFHKSNRYVAKNTNWNNSKVLSYAKLEKDTFEILHFYSLIQLNKSLTSEFRIIFLQTFLNETLKTNFFTRRKSFLGLIPTRFLNYFFKRSLYPLKNKK